MTFYDLQGGSGFYAFRSYNAHFHFDFSSSVTTYETIWSLNLIGLKGNSYTMHFTTFRSLINGHSV